LTAVIYFPKQLTHAAAGTKHQTHPTTASPGDWPTYLANDARTGFNSAETILNKTTISQLKVHWMARAKQHTSAEPVVANGLVYWGSRDGLEHATNLSTGKDAWATNLGQTVQICNNTKYGIFSTATVTQISLNGILTPVLFVGGGDVQIYALNANTGSILW
jgi:outer membrane protein assembly factor BamB